MAYMQTDTPASWGKLISGAGPTKTAIIAAPANSMPDKIMPPASSPLSFVENKALRNMDNRLTEKMSEAGIQTGGLNR